MHFIRSAKILDSLYLTPEFLQADTSKKEELKQQHIKLIISAIDTISFYHPVHFKGRFKDKLPNNALFIVFRQYNSMQDVFEQEFRKEGEGDLKKYVAYLINKYNH